MSNLRMMIRSLRKRIRFIRRLPGNLKKINEIISQPSYYPELERKTRKEMRRDLIDWLMKKKEVNYLYTGYGLDVKNFRNPDDFLPHNTFCSQRDAGVRVRSAFYGKPYNEVVLVRDKYVLASYLESTLGPDVIPKTIGLLDHGQVFLHDRREWISAEDFCNNDFRYVFKEVDGTFGDGVKLVTCQNGVLSYNGKKCGADGLLADYAEKKTLIQEYIVQHEALRAFCTSCVNTIRAITIRGSKSGKIELFAAFLRVGNDADSFVDNRAKGGLAVGIDPETGKLMKYGFPHEQFGTKTDVHPLSGIRFEGYQLPYWKEAVALIINAHKQFPDIATIGWDITMTDEKPVIVEANDGWEISGPQDTHGGLKARWNQLLEL